MPGSLEGSLSQIPGLAGALGYQQFQTEQATSRASLAALLKQQQEGEQIKGILSKSTDLQSALPELAKVGPAGIAVATHLAALEKARQDNAMGAQITGSMGGAGSPVLGNDQMDALGVKLALGSHPGASTVMGIADKRRKAAEETAALSGMKSAPEVQAVGAEGPNIPAPAKPGAVPDYLLNSPIGGIASSAKALQSRINAGSGFTSTSAEKAIENLANAHNTMIQQQTLLSQRGTQAETLLGQRGEQKLNVTGGRESVYVQRMVMGANQAAKDLSNVVQLPLTASTGILGGRKQGPGLLDATAEVMANKVTSQESQAYNAMATGFQRSLAQIESAGLMPSGSLTHQMDAVLFKEGDTNLTKLHKLAQTRQIVEAGMEVVDANPRVSPEEKAKASAIIASIRKSVPFTHSDLIQLQEAQRTNPGATLGSILKSKPAWSVVR